MQCTDLSWFPFHLLSVTKRLLKICFVAVIKFILWSLTHTPNGLPNSEVLQSSGTKRKFISFIGGYIFFFNQINIILGLKKKKRQNGKNNNNNLGGCCLLLTLSEEKICGEVRQIVAKHVSFRFNVA